MKRPSWQEFFISIADAVKRRSNCCSRQVGAVLVQDNRIVSTGYNGTGKGLKNCDEGGCPRCNDPNRKPGVDLDKCLCSHGEENAIVQAAYYGISTRGADMYCTLVPCITCSKMMINAGIKRVYFQSSEYPMHDASLNLLAQAGIECVNV